MAHTPWPKPKQLVQIDPHSQRPAAHPSLCPRAWAGDNFVERNRTYLDIQFSLKSELNMVQESCSKKNRTQLDSSMPYPEEAAHFSCKSCSQVLAVRGTLALAYVETGRREEAGARSWLFVAAREVDDTSRGQDYFKVGLEGS